MFLDIEKEKVDLVRVSDCVDEVYPTVCGLWTDKVVNYVLHGSPKIDAFTFTHQLTKSDALQLRVGERCIGLTWFNNVRAVSKEIHFLVNLERYQLDYLKLGKKVLKVLSGSDKKVLYSYIPSFNTQTLKFAKRLGFTVEGKIKGGTVDLKGARCDMDLIVYSNN